MSRRTLVIHNKWALGDSVCLSALVRDIHRAHPGKFTLQMAGHYAGVMWLNNPYCTKAPEQPTGQFVRLEYLSGIVAAGHSSKKHFLSWFHHDFEKKTGIAVPVTEPRGDIHLTEKEKKARFPGRYWLVVAGGKKDMTAKVWSAAYWQNTVDMLAAQGVRCVQAGAEFVNHFHPRLERVDQAVGTTKSERDFFSLIYNAEGVICGVTAAMHIAAAFEKPCVVIAGGREEPWWESYTNCFSPQSFGKNCAPVKVEHAFLHTLGLLDCGVGNLKKGCWRDRTVPLEQADHTNQKNRVRLCKKPERVGNQDVPACLRMITPDHVVEAVMRYYETGHLPPIGPPTRRYALPHIAVDPGGESYTAKTLVTFDNGSVVKVEPAPADPVRGLTPPPDVPQLVGWNPGWTHALPQRAVTRVGEPPEFAALDRPYVGGRVTIFVLGYGEGLDLIRRCLDSIVDTVPRGRRDIRVALNQPSREMLAYVSAFEPDDVSKVYVDAGSRRKYPAMREMFHDRDHPILTDYVLWFDDDSWCLDKFWLPKLAEVISKNHPQQCRLFGPKYVHDLISYQKQGKRPEKWFKAAAWWRDKPLYLANGTRTAPNGSQIVFSSGGFWALCQKTIHEADIPDVRLNHNGGDITIGCQVTQAGYKVCNFDHEKKLVRWSDAPRRGYRESFPWAG